MADYKEQKLDFTLKELSLSSQSEQVPGSSSTVELRANKLVCVEYPAVVTSVSKMLETLGGEQTLSRVSTVPLQMLFMTNETNNSVGYFVVSCFMFLT